MALKLRKKTEVVFVIESDVVYTIFEHGNTFDPKAKGKPTVNFGIVANHFEDFRVDHTSTKNFKPTGAFAYAAA